MTVERFSKVRRWLDENVEEVITWQRQLVARMAVGPANGGPGEWAKADFLLDRLREITANEIVELPAPDMRAERGSRPNIALYVPGRLDLPTLWTVSHMDIVPAGDMNLWQTDPFTLHVQGDLLIGRGVEDNHQGMVSSLLVLQAMEALDIQPDRPYGLLIVADEETGSAFGLDHVLTNHADIFRPDDLFLVPDFGSPDGAHIEIAEKSMLWLKFEITGKQCHASAPELGVNSLVACSALVLRLNELGKRFPAQNLLFLPPASTFVPSRKEENVPNVNTLPGKDVVYMDCRLLPEVAVETVLEAISHVARGVEAEYGVSITVSTVQKVIAPAPTPPDSPVVAGLERSIRAVRGVEAKPVGIGGGTVAAFLRKRGYHAAVWSTLGHNAHQPNEASSLSATISDAKVIAHLLFDNEA